MVESLIDTFRFFDGAERLERLGADVALGARAAVANNHGKWGLVPGSLGLVVVQVPQKAWLDAEHNKFARFPTVERTTVAGVFNAVGLRRKHDAILPCRHGHTT